MKHSPVSVLCSQVDALWFRKATFSFAFPFVSAFFALMLMATAPETKAQGFTPTENLTQSDKESVHEKTAGILSRSMADNVLDLIGGRTGSRPTQEGWVIGTDYMDSLSSYGEGSSFTLWGSMFGGRSFEADTTESGLRNRYEGDVVSAMVGVDRLFFSDWRAGVAVAYGNGDLEYTAGDGTVSASGDVEKRMLSVHPYLSWHPLPGLSVWWMGGYGFSEYDISEESSSEDLQWEGVDSSDWMTALGAEQNFLFAGGWETAVRVKGIWNRIELDETSDDNGNFDASDSTTFKALLPETTSTNWRVRVEGEVGHLFKMGDSSSIKPYGLVSARWDYGDVPGDDGFYDNLFVDAGAGVEILAGSSLMFDISFYTQVNEGDTEEDSLIVLGGVVYDPRHDGEGMHMSLNQVAGDESGLSPENGFEAVENDDLLSHKSVFEAEMGYGWRTHSGLLRTYTRSRFEDEKRHSVGMDFQSDTFLVGVETGYTEEIGEKKASLRAQLNF